MYVCVCVCVRREGRGYVKCRGNAEFSGGAGEIDWPGR